MTGFIYGMGVDIFSRMHMLAVRIEILLFPR